MPKLSLPKKPNLKTKVKKADPDMGFAVLRFPFKTDDQEHELAAMVDYLRKCAMPKFDTVWSDDYLELRSSVSLHIPLSYLGKNPMERLKQLCGKYPYHGKIDDTYFTVKPKQPLKKICVELEETVYNDLMQKCKRKNKTMREVLQDLIIGKDKS